jgi:phosphoadenosine phosphosulfate reductase
MADSLSDKQGAAIALLRHIAATHSPAVFANSFGAEDMVITHLLASERINIAMFSIDTGRLPAQTYELMAAVEKRYGDGLVAGIGLIFPERSGVEGFVREHGINGFYEAVELRKACCHARKVEPLKRALAGKSAWVTGLRSAQSTTRDALQIEAFDAANGLRKFSPLAHWSETDVWDFIRTHGIPYNALHDQGYPSLGCAPCTRAIEPGEDTRAGRWWWESPETKECGLHMVDGKLQRIEKPADASATSLRASSPLHS